MTDSSVPGNTPDIFVGTAGNDEFTATTATLGTGDTIVDTTTTDADVMNLTATGNVTNGGATIVGIEKVNVTWDAFADANVNLNGFSGTKELSVSTSKLGNLGNLTVTNAGAAAISAEAGMTGTLTIGGVTTGSVTSTAAKVISVTAAGTTTADDTVTVTGSPETTSMTTIGFDAVTMTAGAKTTTITAAGAKTESITTSAATTTVGSTSAAATVDATAIASGATITVNGTAPGTAIDTASLTVGADVNVIANTNFGAASTEVLTLNVADGKAVTLTNTGVAKVAVAGSGSATIKGVSTDLTGDTITDTTTGTLSVAFTDTVTGAAVDTSKMAADLFTFKAGAAAKISGKTGQSFDVVANTSTSALEVGVATNGAADTMTVKLSSAAYGNITNNANDINKLTINAAATAITGADLTIASLNVVNTNDVVLTGTNDVEIKALTAKTIDASELTGALTLGTSTALLSGAVSGATGVNTIAYGAVLADTTATFVGQSGNDVITLVSTAVSAGVGSTAAQATFVTGAGNDKVTAGAIAGILSVTAGEGDDTVVLTASASGTVVLDMGNGTDTLTLDNTVDLKGATSVVLSSVDVINLSGAASGLAASHVTGQTIAYTGIGYDNSTLTITGMDASNTIDLSKSTATDSASTGVKLTLIGNTGVDTITGTGSLDIINGLAGNDIIDGGAGADTITGGAGADTLTGGAGADTFVFAAVDSTATVTDKITDFVGSSDKIKVDITAATVTTTKFTSVVDGGGTIAAAANLGAATIAAYALITDTVAAVDAIQFTYAGKTYFAVEDDVTDGAANAIVIEVTGLTGTVTNADFVVA